MGDEKTPEQVIAELQEQVGNLTKGIATYRDEAKTANQTAKEANETASKAVQQMEEFKKLLDKKEDGVELSADEEKKFAAFAKKNGLVSQADLAKVQGDNFASNVKEVENTAVAEFLEKHPDYDDDEKWKEVLGQFALYKQPTTLPAYRALLNRIYKDLNPNDTSDKDAIARAKIIQRQKLTIGGGNAKTGKEDEEAELETMMKKYPNLSREQIEARLSEVRSLPSLKKK